MASTGIGACGGNTGGPIASSSDAATSDTGPDSPPVTGDAASDVSIPPDVTSDGGTAADADAAGPDVNPPPLGTIATPSCFPPPGVVVGPLSVTVTSDTSGVTIHYTLDGTTPYESSPVVAGPLPLAAPGTTNIRARAFAGGYFPSEVGACTYVDVADCGLPAPQIAPPSGTYENPFVATITTAPTSRPVTICLDAPPQSDAKGSCAPGTSYPPAGVLVGDPTGANFVTSIDAVAVSPGCLDGPAIFATYAFQVAPPTITPPGGVVVVGSTVSFSTATKNATLHYTTDGSKASCQSPKTGSSFVTTGTETHVDVVGCLGGYSDSFDTEATYAF